MNMAEKKRENKELLRLTDVSCAYGETEDWQSAAVRHITLSVAAGERVALAGHTGSGKSTLLQLMGGLLPADGGQIWLDGLELTAPRRPKALALCERVGLVFQYPEYQLFAETVRAELAYGPRNLGWPAERIEREVAAIAAKMGLRELLDENPYRLSGGEKRRVALASVLIMQPPLLLLDEPFVGLDAAGRREFMRLLLEWQRERNAAIVCVSHDIDQLAAFCDRLLVLRQGELKLDAPLRAAFDQVELLAECGVYPPLARQAVRRLRAAGWAIPADAVTLPEAAAVIRAALAAKAGERHG